MAVNIGGYNSGSSPYYLGTTAASLRTVTSSGSFSPGFSGQSGFDVPHTPTRNAPGSAGASTAVPMTVGPTAAPAAGGDLLSKLEGLIQALGSVVKQLGEFLKGAGIQGELPAANAQPGAAPQAAAGQAQTPAQAPNAAPVLSLVPPQPQGAQLAAPQGQPASRPMAARTQIGTARPPTSMGRAARPATASRAAGGAQQSSGTQGTASAGAEQSVATVEAVEAAVGSSPEMALAIEPSEGLSRMHGITSLDSDGQDFGPTPDQIPVQVQSAAAQTARQAEEPGDDAEVTAEVDAEAALTGTESIPQAPVQDEAFSRPRPQPQFHASVRAPSLFWSVPQQIAC